MVAGSSFAALEFLAAVGKQICFITRLRLDAALYEPAPLRLSNTVGRPRRKGVRLPTLQSLLEDSATVWRRVTVAHWYSQGERSVDIATGTAVWFHSGMSAVPLRWVLVRDPQDGFAPQAFLCTDQTVAPDQMLNWFVLRWQVEVTFEEARAHLGIETQRQWSERAIACTTPVLLGLYSVVTLLVRKLLMQQIMPVRAACWYRKQYATFSDTIAMVRRWLWSNWTFSMSGDSPDIVKLPRELYERLTDTLSYAV